MRVGSLGVGSLVVVVADWIGLFLFFGGGFGYTGVCLGIHLHSLAFSLCWRLLIVERGVFHSCSIATFFASSVICMRGAGYDLLDWVDQQEL